MHRARVHYAAHVLHAPRERVTLALELRQAEQARTTLACAGDARGVCRDVRKAVRDELRQLALQARDLRAQRAPRSALVERPAGDGAPVDRQLLEHTHASDSS